MSEEDIEARLARLSRETEGVAPRPDFAERVMAAALASRPLAAPPSRDWWTDLPFASRRVIPAALLVAALGVAFAAVSASASDDAVAGSYDQTELEW